VLDSKGEQYGEKPARNKTGMRLVWRRGRSAGAKVATDRYGGVAFLFVGPGAKGVGGKAMFKLGAAMAVAKQLAAREPERFAVGSTGWVTARFTAAAPLPKVLWQAWLQESFELAAEGSKRAKPPRTARPARVKPAARRPAR
jgi:hypothetical protein